MKKMKSVLSFVLCLVMLVSLLPGTALEAFAAKETPTIVIAGSDYQNSGSAPKTNVENILAQIKEDYSAAHGFLFGGDYSQIINNSSSTTSGIKELKGVVQGVYDTGMEEVYVQGNHDASVNDLTATGDHDTDDYGVFSINEDDFSSGGNVSSNMLTDLENYLDRKVSEKYKKPVFVTTHLPLHATSRGDNTGASEIFTLLNEAGESGLNIIFLFGHNHSGSYDDYLGGGAIYLPKGSSITVAGGSTNTLNFTYMNYGYVGYSNSVADNGLTMTAFEIYGDEVIIKRYDANGLHNLKSRGVATSGYTANTDEYDYAELNLSTGESTPHDLSADSGNDNIGSTGGSTATPEGGDWVTITDGKGQVVYELDTDGVIDTGVEYLIVAESYAKALSSAASAESAAVDITIDGNYAYTDSEDYGWIFTASGSDYTIRLNGSTYLGRSSSNLAEGDSGDTWTVEHESSGAYTITQESSSSWGWGNTTYYVRWSNSNGYFQASSYNTDPVRLYKYVRTESAGDPEYAKLAGTLTCTVARGLDQDAVLAEVMQGIDVVVSDDKTSETILKDSNTDITWTMASDYDGAVPGEYAVTISYKGIELGTAEVIVPEVTITGCDLMSYTGTVGKGSSKDAETGAYIKVSLEDGTSYDGTSYNVPVTVGMLTDAAGNTPSTKEITTITGLTVSYEDWTFENFTLNVTAKAGNNYPEYPNQGAVKVSKTGTGIQFQSTGVAQVEISASGIPMNQGVDVLLILDTSSSMSMRGSLTDANRTRMDVLKECVNALIVNLKEEREDGSLPDVDIAIVDFNGYTGNKNTNYIGTTARSTTSLGGLLTDGWVDVQNLSDTWANTNIPQGSGTNYDHGLLQGYELLSARQETESSRKQFVLFMSDGAPFQYNGVNSNSLSSDWENWILGSYTQSDVEALPHVSNPEFYYGNNNGNGQKHRVAEAIKGSPEDTFEIVTYSSTGSTGTTKLETVSGLGATMYSVGLALEGTNMPTDAAGQEAILTTIASSPELCYCVTSAAGLQAAFDDFAGEVLMAATNARFVDQMGDDYDLQMGQILDLDKNPIGVENKIEILSYQIWTRADYLAESCTADQVGDRKLDANGKPIATVLETITFKDDGTEVYSDKINGGTTNILADGTQDGFEKGVIYAKNFMYNTNKDKAVAVNGVSIPTGIDEHNLTTGSTNMLPAETFYWKLGTIKTTELAMRYYVYLTGSMEGTREAGSYPTNEYATLYYDNYLENPCYKETVSPVMAWKAANVSYAFYLVDENGNIIVNQTTGGTGSFANKIAVTNPVVYKEILLNNTNQVNSIDVASTGVLPEGYELYDDQSVYTIQIKSDATGSWNIAKGDATKASTYVTQFDPDNAAAYSNELTKDSNADFTHTVVWFAVVWKVQALPDTVVIDYGLPVDISVLRNDMFGANGKLAGVGAITDSLKLEGHDTTNALNSINYNGTYGTAAANPTTGKVRYTPADMEMNGYDKFAYAVDYTGATNPGYYYDTVTVIPATTIYFEDNFVDYKSFTWDDSSNGWAEKDDSLWSIVGTVNSGAVQGEDRPGQYALTDANNIYGYDSANLNMTTYSMGSAHKATVDYDNYAQAQFEFYGTGFDVISMTSNMTGTILVDVEKMDGDGWNEFDNFTVDTYYGYKQDSEDNWVVNPNASDSLYQVPVIKMVDKPYGQYRVTIKATYESFFDHVAPSNENGTYDFYLDAIRIYDPANDGASDGTTDTTIEDAYKADHEGWPSYIELRNALIDAQTLGNAEANTKVKGLVFIDGDASVGDAQLDDYISYGPNNEVYLAPGQCVAFQLETPENLDRVHIGIKSADGRPGTYTIKNIAQTERENGKVEAGDYYNAKTNTIDTTTDMYYDLTGWKNDIIVISNTGDQHNTKGVISITNIKSTYTSAPAPEEQNAHEPAEVSIYMTPKAAELVLNAMKPEPVNPFADIQKEQFFYDSVLWAVKNGITNGVDAAHFGPYLYCNRAQVVTFLWRAAGSPAPETRNNPFTDVPADGWYTEAVLWAVENGITNGLTDTTFGPDALCNRAQVVTFLWRANGSRAYNASNPFEDVPADAFYHDAVIWALNNGITTGAAANAFDPNGTCMRAHVVTFLYRAEQLPELSES